MTDPFFSICIPAYNRSIYLQELLDSIVVQEFTYFEVIIAEDNSPERDLITQIVNMYRDKLPIKYILNKTNQGYDRNLRVLISESSGKYLLFMGNDDLLGNNALISAHKELLTFPSVTCAIRAYSVFSSDIKSPNHDVHYFKKTRIFSGREKFRVGVRRFGILSGLIFSSEIAKKSLSSSFDGALYYQTYVGIECLKNGNLLYIDDVISMSRDDVAPDFGSSGNESLFTPGRYTSIARLTMISGVTKIFESALSEEGDEVINEVKADYAAFIYPFFKDQLNLGIKEYIWLWNSVGKLGYSKFLKFHLIVFFAYLLKNSGMNRALSFYRFFRGIKIT